MISVISLVLLPFVSLSLAQFDDASFNNGLSDPKGFKSVIKYLGTDFVMPDGCSLPQCSPNLPSCNKFRKEAAAEYNQCLGTQDASIVACLTDILPNDTNITIPVFSNLCSARCYLRDKPKTIRRIHPCPYNGEKQNVDPNTQRLF
eukprot:TRINITY_DN2015_c0_g1_i1.p1 TRINITY_DN2015_c0_g1~~TRINITY_DN2015_c0_g1_i1.p1  ORF type:complete len:146 (+),score=14.14 TRINITY_DN2015_c0_g1_i1:195-632(+)